MPLPQYLAAVFSVYGVAVMAYVTLAGGVVDDRSRHVLKRLRGTPMPPWAYLAGRIGAALVVGLMTVALVFGIGAVFFGVRVGALPLLLSVLVYVVIIGCAASLGMLLASLVDSPQSAIALALATLLPAVDDLGHLRERAGPAARPLGDRLGVPAAAHVLARRADG